MKMEDGELNSLIEGLSNSNQSSPLVLTQQLQQQNSQTHFVVSPYPTNTYLSSSESPFPTPSPSPSIVLRSPAPVKSPITNLQNIKSPIPVKSPGFQNVKSPSQSFQNVKSPTANFQNVKSPNLYQVKSPGVANIKSPASGVVKSPANIRSPGVCNPQSPAQAHSPFQHQVGGSPNNNRSPAPPPPTPSPTAPSPARPNTPQPVSSQYPPNTPNSGQVQFSQTGQIVGRTQMTCGGPQTQLPKSKQPLQILPKPLTATPAAQKQTVPRLNATGLTQQTPLLLNQPQNASPALVLNQVLTSGAPVLVQPAGPGGTVHLMLRPPTPTLQSGPGPPQNKMIITNATQPQTQATVLIPNRQQVMRIMTAQGPMQLQQIQTPTGPQFIAIPQNQALSFSANSVLVQSSPTNAIQVQPNSAGAIQLQQSTSGVLQSSTFPPTSLPVAPNQITLQNQILQSSTPNSTIGTLNKKEEKCISTDSHGCSIGINEQKKIVIDNKINSKKNANAVNTSSSSSSSSSNLNNNNVIVSLSNSSTALSSNLNINNKKTKNGKNKSEDEGLNKNFTKTDGLMTNSTSVSASGSQKNITSSLRQIRPGAFANRRQNQNSETREKTEDTNKNLNNLTRIIDSVASNTEHLISSSPPKVDNLTATINSVAENIKSPVPDEIMSNLSFSDVFISGNKTLSLNKRPNLTIVQKQNKAVPPDSEEPNLNINRLILSPKSHTGVDFGNITDSYESLELGGVVTSAGVQTNDNQSFLMEQNSSSNMSGFTSQDESKKGKKKASSKKKGKKEENKLDLWDLMKSAGIGDDEFDEPNDGVTFPQDNVKITEGLEISAADTELIAQLQSASQMPNNVRVVVGEDGRLVFFNGSNVLVPDAVQTGAASCAAEPSEADSILQNMILPDNVFNFTPQALATAQTQLNQLIQDHGGLTTSSADQQLLSQIFGSSSSNISNTAGNSNNVSNSSSSNSVMQSTSTPLLASSAQTHPPMTSSGNDPMIVNVTSSSSEVTQTDIGQKPEIKSEFIGGPPPGLPPFGPDSLVMTNNNGVPTLVASPALMQYLQTHQGIIQFQHDPVTKTIQPSLIIPHPQSKVEVTTQDSRNDKISTVVSSARGISQSKEVLVNKPRTELKSSVGTITEDRKNVGGVYNIVASNPVVPGVVKLSMVKFVKDNPPLLQIAAETNNLITFKESNKGLSEKDIVEIDRKIQHNRTLLDQCIVMGNCRTGQSVAPGVPNVIIKDCGSNEGIFYQLSGVSLATDKIVGGVTVTDNKTTETQTLDDLQHLNMGPIKAVQTGMPNVNSPTPNLDFQTKFLESIGMATKVTKTSIGTGTTASPNPQTPLNVQTSPAKRGRKKKAEKIQNQATQADGKMEITFNIAQLTPEQNLKLNQALQSRGVTASQVHNFDAIKQIIQEEIRKITAGALQNTSIRFVSAPTYQEEASDSSDQSISNTSVLYNNQNVNPIIDQSSNQANIISLQGNDVVAINNGNQRIFTSQNQLLSSGHLVASNNQILAIGGNHNQLVSLGNPISSSNQLVTLGNPPNVMSMNGSNVATPGSVIVGSKGNVVAIVHQTPVSGQGPGIVQRVQTIQLATPKQQVSQPVTSQASRFQAQTSQQNQQLQTQPSQNVSLQQQNQVQQMYITTNTSCSNTQPCKTSFTTQSSASCGTNTPEINSTHSNVPKLTVPPTLMISDVPTSNYGPLYVSPNTSGKNVTKCEKGTSPIQIQMGTQTTANMEYRSGKMSTGTMTSPNTGKPQAVVAPAIVIQQTEAQSPTWQMKPRNQQQQQLQAPVQQQQQQPSMSPLRNQVPAISRTTFIEQQMRSDQTGATMPDTRTPFLSKSDACKRLIRYHIMDEKALSPQDLAAADDMFEATAQHLLDKFRVMKEKYKYLLMLESMREVSTAERIMVDRNFIIEERIELEELREKEKRLQEEFENPTICYSSTGEATIMKTETTFDETKDKRDESFYSEEAKFYKSDKETDSVVGKNKNLCDNRTESVKDSSFKLAETNRNYELTQIKAEAKECKNTRTLSLRNNRSRSPSPENDDFDHSISGKCKAKSSRTFSDGSSKSSLDSSKDDDSGTDINAQVQSAIDSILNLQKCENSPDDSAVTPKKKKKRKLGDRSSDCSKRVKTKDYDSKRNSSDDSDYDDGCGSDADLLLDEAIRSIMTS